MKASLKRWCRAAFGAAAGPAAETAISRRPISARA